MPTGKKAVSSGQAPGATPDKNLLSERQKRFVEQYLIDFNATRAYRDAYEREGHRPSVEVAQVEGHRLLRRPKIRRALDAKCAPLFQKLKISREKVLRELAYIGLSDTTRAVEVRDGHVRIRDTKDMDRATRRAIQQITETETKEGGSVSIRFHDKASALNTLAKVTKLVSQDGADDGSGDGEPRAQRDSDARWKNERDGILERLRKRAGSA